MRGRIFVAIDASGPEEAHPLATVSSGAEGVNWSARENLHITLVYIGELAQSVHEIIAKLEAISIAPFELTLSGVGTFDLQNGYSALYVGIQMTENLRLLQQRCANAVSGFVLGCSNRTYKPHITVGLIKTAEIESIGSWKKRNITFKSNMPVSDFCLYSSHRTGVTVELDRLWQRSHISPQRSVT